MATSEESYAGQRDRDYFHIMLNLDSFEDSCRPPRELAEGFLAAAREQQQDPALEPTLKAFPYSNRRSRRASTRSTTDWSRTSSA